MNYFTEYVNNYSKISSLGRLESNAQIGDNYLQLAYYTPPIRRATPLLGGLLFMPSHTLSLLRASRKYPAGCIPLIFPRANEFLLTY